MPGTDTNRIRWEVKENVTVSRRKLIEAAGVAALATPVRGAATMPPPQFEGPGTPKIGLGLSDGSLGMPAGSTTQDPAERGVKRISQ